MSANYWNSTQRVHWQFTRDELALKRNELIHLEARSFTGDNAAILQNPIKYDCNLRIYIHNLIIKLGRKLCVRQVVIATLEIFISRFLTQVSIKEINIYVLVTTLIYVACKIEECPQHIRNILNESRNLWPEYIPNDLTKILEFEFYLIEELNSYLVIHHPYRSLTQLISIFSTENQTAANPIQIQNNSYELKLNLSNEEIQMSWSIINDSYITDVSLLYPPHIILVMSIYMTLSIRCDTSSKVQRQQHLKIEKFIKFLAISNIDLDEVIESTQDMLTLYEQWEHYDEHHVKKNIHQLLMSLSRSGL